MKSLLLAGAAAVLMFSSPAMAQTTPEAVPASPPPIQAPAQTPDVNVEGQVGSQTQTPPDIATQGPAAADPAQTEAQAAANAEAMAASPAAAAPAVPTLAGASDVCQPRITTVHFGARASALSRDNSNTIERAVDAASVCRLHQVVVAPSGEGRLASRRAEAARATLVRQGVPAELITVSADAAGDAAAGQVDVRMSFAGVAGAGATAASAAAPSAPDAAPAPQPEANEAEETPGS